VSLLFGKPDLSVFIEDLVLRYNLDELKDNFYSILDITKKRILEENVYPFTDNERIMNNIRGITQEIHKHTLYR
jgi:hypothetical protein